MLLVRRLTGSFARAIIVGKCLELRVTITAGVGLSFRVPIWARVQGNIDASILNDCARAMIRFLHLINRSKRNVDLTTQTVLEAVFALAEKGFCGGRASR